ncbi:hypothetical protein [Microcoleus sp. Z1_B2]|uniref:hypothetical protein n=1 Tax=Microcoleus sp. Z1_B2 TaxID=3055429 RepID=UPI002FD13393
MGTPKAVICAVKNSPKGESSLGHPQAIIIKMPSLALPETLRPIARSSNIQQFEAKHLPNTTVNSATKYNKI